jgi:ferredoxin
MKVVVNFDTCQSNAVCVGLVPEVFEIRDDGFLYLLDENPPAGLKDKLQMAEIDCPTRSISLVEDE